MNSELRWTARARRALSLPLDEVAQLLRHVRLTEGRYLECRSRGLPIGSGAMEGGVRFIGKDRMDRTGMRWNVAGAEAVLQLRCVKYSDRWEKLAAKRAAESLRRYATARSAWNKAA